MALLFITSVHATDMRPLLFEGNCVTCHHADRTISAPSIMEIKANYLRAFPQKEDFVAYMSVWIVKPNKESSLMLEAIKKHNLMPELGFDINTSKDIAAYIYETDFNQLK